MTVNSFAAAYGLSPSTVYTMLGRKELGCIRRAGGAIRILDRHAKEWESRFECPALDTQTQNQDWSESQAAELGISDGPSPAAAAARQSALGQKMRRRLGLSSQNSR
jgi:hypothetical protein